MGDSLASNKLSPSLVPCINRVMSKCSMIPTLIFPGSISILECIDTLTSYFLTLNADMSSSLDLWTSHYRAFQILHQNIHQVNRITATIQQHNDPGVAVVQNARCVEMWCGQGNQFDNSLIQGDRATHKNSCVCHHA